MRLQIENMTVEQKIGMVLCARRFDNQEDIDFSLELIKNHALGCAQVLPHQTEVMKKIKETADYPILIIADMESGFQRAPLPKVSLMSLSACNKPEYYRAYAKGIAHYAKRAGYSGAWSPVVDVLQRSGPCIVSRVISNDPYKVAKAAAEISAVFKEQNFLSCGKHYPGVTGFGKDTHMTEGYSVLTEEEIKERNLLPYKYLLERGLLPSVMTQHSVYKNIDPDYPATLSKKTIDIIRNMGFDGVLFTDSLAMMGILQKYGEENVYGMAVAAGNDVILTNYRTPTKDCYEMLLKNYRDGLFTEERLDEAVRRVLKAQELTAEMPDKSVAFTKEDEEILNSVAKDCITAITDDGVSAALDGKNEDKLFVILEELEGKKKESSGREITAGDWYNPEQIEKRIEEKFPGAGIVRLPEFPSASNNDYVLNTATKYKEVVFVTFCKTCAYLGTDGLTRRAEAVINALVHSKKVSAVVHFGNPFAMQEIEHVPRRVFGYTIPDSQLYAIDLLAGEIEAKGTLPFDIEFD